MSINLEITRIISQIHKEFVSNVESKIVISLLQNASIRSCIKNNVVYYRLAERLIIY